MNKNTLKAYDEWAFTYDESPHILHSLEKQLLLNLIEPHDSDNILDVACGTGSYLAFFARKGARVTGVDISPKMIEVAKRKAPSAKLMIADIEAELPFEDEAFNKIVCSQALQHIKSIEPVLREFKRLAKKKGNIILSVPHPEMDRAHYKKNVSKQGINFTSQAELFEHKFYEYLEAIDYTGLDIAVIKQVPLTKKVVQFFSDEIFEKIEGKYLGVIFKLTKPD